MVSLDLDKFLSGHVFTFLFIFSRFGTVLMIMPGIGEVYVSPRIRMLLALSISFLLIPALSSRMPAIPPDIPTLTVYLLYEIMVGLFFGTMLRLIMDSLETAGAIIALQTGLSNATVFNPSLASQSPLPSGLLGVAGTTLLFITGLDHTVLRSIMATYDLFPPHGTNVIGDMTDMITHTMSRSFIIGIEMSMPFIVMGLLMFIALGLIQKLMPMVQLFLIVVPLQIWGGLFLIYVTLAAMMVAWLHFFDNTINSLFMP